jgi:TolB protein
VKPGAPLKIRFVHAGANAVTVTFAGSEAFSATATGADPLQALWAAVDAAIVAAGKKYAVKPIFAATKLAFVRESGANRKEIYAGDLMLPNARALTAHGSLSYSPNWTPDGRAVYYTSHYKNGAADVFRAEIGGGVSPVATYKGTNTGGAVSPDGSRVALAMSPKGTLDIYVASASGAGAHAIVSSADVETSPCWSPDGSRIAYTGGVSGRPQIMIVPASGGASRKVSTGGYSSEPAWNPVLPNQIAYTQGNCAGIGVADLGGASFTVSVKGGQSVSHPAWCADGRHVVVTLGSGKSTKLGLLDTQSGKVSVISGTQFGSCSDPATRIAK